MQENECGKIVREQWFESAQTRQELELDAFTVMPNHLRGILWIVGPNGVRPATYGARPDARATILSRSSRPRAAMPRSLHLTTISANNYPVRTHM